MVADLTPPLRLAADLARRAAWMAKGPFPVCIEGSGLRFLDGGWSRPEPEIVWTEGRRAGLRLPFSVGRPVACRLTGFVIGAPQRTVRVRFWLEDVLLCEVANATGATKDVTIDLLFEPKSAGTGALAIGVEVSGPVRPQELGASLDSRLLGLALREIDLLPTSRTTSVEGGLAEFDPGARPKLAEMGSTVLPGVVADVVESRQPKLAVVMAPNVDTAASLASALAHLGCLEVKVLHTRSQLEQLARDLRLARQKVDLAVIGGEAEMGVWFQVQNQTDAEALDGASLALLTGDPYGCPPDFFRYSQRWEALIQFSDHAVVASPRLFP